MLDRKVQREWEMRRFTEVVKECGLIDLGYRGTYIYIYKQKGSFLEIKASLDRTFGNSEWKNLLNRYEVSHLISSVSGHLPLLVKFQKRCQCFKEKLSKVSFVSDNDEVVLALLSHSMSLSIG
ncbi:unnamed protein product [Rhodiola kirilowii]